MESHLLELKKVAGSCMSGLKGLISQELSYHQESLVFVLSLGEGCFGGDLCCTSVVTVPLAWQIFGLGSSRLSAPGVAAA